MSNNLGIKFTSLFLMSVVIEMYVEFPKFQTGIFVQWQAPSLGPVFAVGEKGKKRGEMISASEASPAVAWGKGGGALRHAGFWYHALIGQTSSCLRFAVLLTVSRYFNVTQYKFLC